MGKHEFGRSARTQLYYRYKAAAKFNGREFSLTKEQFYKLVTQNCKYCNKKPSNVIKPKGNNGPFIYNGIDRVDNSIGYVLDNCVPCCTVCNYAKATMDEYEFNCWIDGLVEYRIKNNPLKYINHPNEVEHGE